MRRHPVVDAWAAQFGVQPDEVLSQVRLLTRLINGVDDQVLRLRLHVYAGPDRELDDSVRALHERGHRVTFYEPDAFVRQKHRDLPNPDYATVVGNPARVVKVAEPVHENGDIFARTAA